MRRRFASILGLLLAGTIGAVATLREIGAQMSGGQKLSSGELDEIGRKHGYRDSGDFFLPRLAIIAAILALVAVLVTLLTSAYPFRVAAIYALGTTLATIVTVFALGPGDLPPAVFIAGTLFG